MAPRRSTRTKKASTPEEEKGRPFKLPALMKFEDLKRKFSDVIEINWRGLDKILNADSQLTKEADSNHRPSVITNGVSHRDELNITRRDRLESGASNNVDNLDEIQFRAPIQGTLRVKRTPKLRNNEEGNESEEEAPKNPRGRPPGRPKANTNGTNNGTNNGVKGSRSRTQVRSKEPEKTTRSGRVRQQTGKVNGRYVFNGHRIKPAQEPIDTKGFIDDALICFLPELCNRAQIELLSDPIELVTRSKFKIELEEWKSKEFEDEAEIECVDMTED